MKILFHLPEGASLKLSRTTYKDRVCFFLTLTADEAILTSVMDNPAQPLELLRSLSGCVIYRRGNNSVIDLREKIKYLCICMVEQGEVKEDCLV